MADNYEFPKSPIAISKQRLPLSPHRRVSVDVNLQPNQAALNLLPPSSRPRPLTEHCARPIPNSYWATPLVLACEYPWCPGMVRPKLDALLSAGVRTFIDLTEPHELSPYAPYYLFARADLLDIPRSELEYHNFPIHDRGLPTSLDYMQSILEVLRDNESRSRVTAVHCRGGIGRTGMVIGCWLIESGLARDGDEALKIIAGEWRTVEKCKRFPCSPETGAQFEYVRTFQPMSPRGQHSLEACSA